MENEFITSAAIKLVVTGDIFKGIDHAVCIDRIHQEGIESIPAHVQGFVTSTGRFVDRIQAAKIAIACGQIEKLSYNHERLFSEELCYQPPKPMIYLLKITKEKEFPNWEPTSCMMVVRATSEEDARNVASKESVGQESFVLRSCFASWP